MLFILTNETYDSELIRGIMVYVLGIDIGSAASKGVALDEKGVLGSF